MKWFKNITALATAAEGLHQRIGDEPYVYLKPELHLLRGQPRSVIPDLAAQLRADLVVMGTVSRTGIPGLIMGNTAEIIIGRISCSVLAVKPPGFASPVTLD